MAKEKAVRDYVITQGLKGKKPLFQVLMDGWKVYQEYGGKGAPNTFVIDQKGQIRFVHRAYNPGVEKIIKREIEALFAEAS